MDTSIELYLAVTMVAIVAIALWEAAKSCQRQTTSVVSLRTLEARRALTRQELRRLQALLERPTLVLTAAERADLADLASRLRAGTGTISEQEPVSTDGRNGPSLDESGIGVQAVPVSTSSRRRGEVVVGGLGLGRQESLPSTSSTGHVGDASAAGSRTVEVGVQTTLTFQLLEPPPTEVIIRENAVPIDPVYVAAGGRTVHINRHLGAAQQHSSRKAAMSAMAWGFLPRNRP